MFNENHTNSEWCQKCNSWRDVVKTFSESKRSKLYKESRSPSSCPPSWQDSPRTSSSWAASSPCRRTGCLGRQKCPAKEVMCWTLRSPNKTDNRGETYPEIASISHPDRSVGSTGSLKGGDIAGWTIQEECRSWEVAGSSRGGRINMESAPPGQRSSSRTGNPATARQSCSPHSLMAGVEGIDNCYTPTCSFFGFAVLSSYTFAIIRCCLAKQF